ncbi:MAG TPA: hypothetical protein VK805_13085 [Candidatus Baltobacteraceae bacterium]|nr:hypothetical protein [Candidatus Baltobacteraceae bacterium]
MKDARAGALPLVNSEIGDWTLLFGQWNLLPSDLRIGQFTRDLGWLGMFATIAFLAYHTYRDAQLVARPLSPS